MHGAGLHATMLSKNLTPLPSALKACGMQDATFGTVLPQLLYPEFRDLGFGFAITVGRKPSFATASDVNRN